MNTADEKLITIDTEDKQYLADGLYYWRGLAREYFKIIQELSVNSHPETKELLKERIEEHVEKLKLDIEHRKIFN